MLQLADDWVWDSWCADDGERFHLYFLRAPRALLDPGRRHTHAVIGHAVSEDLTRWDLCADALSPAPGRWDDLALWTGSVARGDDGVWRMYYSALSRSNGLGVRDQRLGLAESSDLFAWRRVGERPLVDPDPRWYRTLTEDPARSETWRDPHVFRDPAGDGWHMLITARAPDAPRLRDGVIGHARSGDMVHWTLQPPLAGPSGFGQTEVTQMRMIEGRATLLFTCQPDEQSPEQRGRFGDHCTWYVVGESLLGPFDLDAARPFLDDPRLFAAPLIHRRDGGWALLGFRRRSPEVGSELAVVDPIPVAWRDGELRRVWAPAPDLDDLRSDEGWLFASSLSTGEGDPGRFHALFGRDSLISALALLPVAPEIARATLRELAARQGTRRDRLTLEAPGKIGHEFRERPPAWLGSGWPPGPFEYFATADATSWFLVLLCALGDTALSAELEGAWRGAAAWLARALDAGGGFMRHEPPGGPGLTQQGWRDTNDPTEEAGGGILAPDGSAPALQLADADTQAVAYAALRALTRLDPDQGWEARAAEMRDRVSAHFGPEVMAIDVAGAPVAGAGSQLGWLLWAGALHEPEAQAAAARLCAPDVLTDYGLRTLSSDSPVFAAHAYHRGSVWPFDSWLGWGGLQAAGRLVEAERVRTGVLKAVARVGSAPELYAVNLAGEPEATVLSNHRQAWTVAAVWALANRWDGRAGLD
jgi:beta-fructofuranosidase